MKTTSLFPKATFCIALILTIFSCSKQDIAPQDDIYRVKPEVLTPIDGDLVELGVFDVEATFTPYGEGMGVDIIWIKLLDTEYGYVLDDVASLGAGHAPFYHYSGTATANEKGRNTLKVCSYKDESTTVGNYPTLTFDGECVYVGIFAQDKVGNDFQVRTELIRPYEEEDIVLNETMLIDYKYAIKKGDNGILMVEILDASNNVIDTLLETEISDSGDGQLSYQFAEAGTYYVKLKAQQPDGSNENSWTSKVVVE